MKRETTKTIFALLLFTLALLFSITLAGCGSTDPLIEHALDRRKTIWEEDRRPPATIEQWNAHVKARDDATAVGDKATAAAAQEWLDLHLEPDTLTSRNNELDAQDRYRKSK
jgi:hypothetical protein